MGSAPGCTLSVPAVTGIMADPPGRTVIPVTMGIAQMDVTMTVENEPSPIRDRRP